MTFEELEEGKLFKVVDKRIKINERKIHPEFRKHIFEKINRLLSRIVNFGDEDADFVHHYKFWEFGWPGLKEMEIEAVKWPERDVFSKKKKEYFVTYKRGGYSRLFGDTKFYFIDARSAEEALEFFYNREGKDLAPIIEKEKGHWKTFAFEIHVYRNANEYHKKIEPLARKEFVEGDLRETGHE
jgi:hypothetical protein